MSRDIASMQRETHSRPELDQSLASAGFKRAKSADAVDWPDVTNPRPHFADATVAVNTGEETGTPGSSFRTSGAGSSSGLADQPARPVNAEVVNSRERRLKLKLQEWMRKKPSLTPDRAVNIVVASTSVHTLREMASLIRDVSESNVPYGLQPIVFCVLGARNSAELRRALASGQISIALVSEALLDRDFSRPPSDAAVCPVMFVAFNDENAPSYELSTLADFFGVVDTLPYPRTVVSMRACLHKWMPRSWWQSPLPSPMASPASAAHSAHPPRRMGSRASSHTNSPSSLAPPEHSAASVVSELARLSVRAQRHERHSGFSSTGSSPLEQARPSPCGAASTAVTETTATGWTAARAIRFMVVRRHARAVTSRGQAHSVHPQAAERAMMPPARTQSGPSTALTHCACRAGSRPCCRLGVRVAAGGLLRVQPHDASRLLRCL
jgi:hypothetical protein